MSNRSNYINKDALKTSRVVYPSHIPELSNDLDGSINEFVSDLEETSHRNTQRKNIFSLVTLTFHLFPHGFQSQIQAHNICPFSWEGETDALRYVKTIVLVESLIQGVISTCIYCSHGCSTCRLNQHSLVIYQEEHEDAYFNQQSIVF